MQFGDVESTNHQEALVSHCAVFAPSASSSGMSCGCLAHRLGNAADQPDRTRRYGSDLTDAEWAIVRPLLPVPSWLIRARRLARDHETRIDSAEAMAWWAASIPATRRLARSGRPAPRRIKRSAA